MKIPIFRNKNLIIALAIAVVIGVGYTAVNMLNNSKQADANSWNERTVYCSYVQCHLRPGSGKVAAKRWVRVSANGYRTCYQTGIVWVKSVSKPTSPTAGVCLAL